MKQASDSTKKRVRMTARTILLTLILGPIGFVLGAILNRGDDEGPS